VTDLGAISWATGGLDVCQIQKYVTAAHLRNMLFAYNTVFEPKATLEAQTDKYFAAPLGHIQAVTEVYLGVSPSMTNRHHHHDYLPKHDLHSARVKR
jgi:hypothetical protein